VIQNFLELASGFRASACRQIGEATNVGGIKITSAQKIFRTSLDWSPALDRLM